MTLRNWERRYGVVVGARGAGQQRADSTDDLDKRGEAHALVATS